MLWARSGGNLVARGGYAWRSAKSSRMPTYAGRVGRAWIDVWRAAPAFRDFLAAPSPAGPAVFARDRESSKQVWSAREGYPGDPAYRDFYRDIGRELPEEYLAGVYPDVGHRRYSGIKYHRITGSENKEYYRRDWAMEQSRRMLPISFKVGFSKSSNYIRSCRSNRWC